jgi:hypothetical protein
MLEITPTLETSLDTAVVDVHSEVADWSDATTTQVAPAKAQSDPQSVFASAGRGAALLDRLNLLTQRSARRLVCRSASPFSSAE